MKFICYLFVGLLLGACASTEKPYYILTDSELHLYQGGDSLTYSLLSIGINSEFTGRLTQTFTNVDLLTPERKTFKAIAQESTTQGNVTFNFATPNFSQSENGNLILQAFVDSGKTYWLADSKTQDIEQVLYPSPISNLNEVVTSNVINLLVCEINTCQDEGSTDFSITPLNVDNSEKITTDYADFDTYKFSIIWNITLSSDDQSASLKTFRLTGEQWIYPPLGIVKFTYTLDTNESSNTLIGTLASTNIAIANENKSMQ